MLPEHWIKKQSGNRARLSHVPLCSSLRADFMFSHESTLKAAHLWVRQVQSLCRCRWLVVLWARVEPVLVVINFCSPGILRDICTHVQQPTQEKTKVKQPQRRAARLQTDESKDNKTADRQRKMRISRQNMTKDTQNEFNKTKQRHARWP